jgi:two-component system, OmpR family, sensor histidine kinase VicK
LTHSSSQPPTSAIREKTEILYGTENVLGSLLEFLLKAKRIDSCGDSKSLSLVFEVDMYNKLLTDIKNRGIKVRQVTDITKENIRYCKDLLEFGYEIRHLNDIKTNFSVSETEYLATAAALREAQPIPQIIYSNVKDIVEQQRYVFESFWNRATPAETRINEIEKGIELEKTHVIQDPQSIKKLFVDIVKSAQHEVLLILPTVNAFLREHRIGIIQLLLQAAKERSVNVRILTPTNDVIDDLLRTMKILSYQEGERKKDFDFDLRSISLSSEETAVSTVTIVVVDKKESLVFEKTDDTKENFIEAVGSATYSNSKPTVMSYVSIFKNLWKQADLYEQLKSHDKMQKEFINIASHEMKTPTQAIVGYADLIKKHPEKRDDMMQAISRNAVRLQRLTNDILDVTRIDSNTLNPHKELFNLDDLIANVIQDNVGYIEKENLSVKLLYNIKQDINEPLSVDADKDRIAQVISNLLNNAIKFTSKRMDGVIFVSAERKKNSNQEEVIVSIKDTGEGINPEIQPRLFTKFATRSFSGTGLGLYISKSIVEAHGGKMWAENNPEGNGATFTFTLPLSRKEDDRQL